MKQNVTIAFLADGKTQCLHGPDVPFTTQRKTVQGFRDADVPAGVVRVEIWQRGVPVKTAHKKATPKPEKPAAEAPKETPKASPEAAKDSPKPAAEAPKPAAPGSPAK